MNRLRGLSIWRANRASIIAGCLLVAFSGGAIACDETLVALIGPDRTHVRQQQNRALRSGQSHYLEPVPPELARTARENLPMFQIAHRLNPIQEADSLMIDAYLGSDYASTTSDVFVMPLDSRSVCILAPESVIFLSDNATHHYVTIDEIDFAAQSVTLVDPWASVSFLLPGRNLVGIRAEIVAPVNGVDRLKMAIDDFLRVLRGVVEAADPQMMFKAIEKNYPELANSEDYLFWKYSHMIGSGRYDDIITAISDLQMRGDIGSKPRLKLLVDFATDITGIVLTGLPHHEKGNSDADKDTRFTAFLERVEGYSRLPWILRWLLIDRSKAAGDSFLLPVVDRLLRADTRDIDVRIAKAQTLIRLQRPVEAHAEADLAEQQWNTDLGSLIQADTPGKAIAMVFDSPIKLVSVNVLRWRYGRIRLAQLTSSEMDRSGADVPSSLAELIKRYPRSQLEFLYDYLHLYALTEDTAKQDALLDAAVFEVHPQALVKPSTSAAANTEMVEHLSGALYQFFRADRIADVNRPSDHRVFTTQVLRREICRLSENGRSAPQPNKNAAAALQKMCSSPNSR